jgi:hypothetical protein
MYLAPRYLARAFDHFKHGMAMSGPDVQKFGLAPPAKMSERQNMRVGQI